MAPRPTGFSASDASDDFLRARRRQAVARLGRVLARRDGVAHILPFEEVVAALGRTGERSLGSQVVELDSIIGTVDRGRGFDRRFRPTGPEVRTRWERIAGAMRRGEPLPPVDLYRIGEVHFVRDGHHRVSVARSLGHETIEARVTEVSTRIGADRGLRLADLPRKSHERLFGERVPLGDDERAALGDMDPMMMGQLAEGLEAWAYRHALESGETLDRAEAARRWYAEEFAPTVALVDEAGERRSGESAARAYLRLGSARFLEQG